MWTVEAEVDKAIVALGLQGDDVVKLPREEARRVQTAVMERFVEGNPRSWWLSLRGKSAVQVKDDDYDYSFIDEHFAGAEALWFIPETDEFDLPVYRATPAAVKSILLEAPFFEFYLVALDFRRLVIETDHGEVVSVVQDG